MGVSSGSAGRAAPQTAVSTVSTAVQTGADPVIYVRSGCDGAVSEVGCADDVDYAGGNYAANLTIDALEPGTYYVIADSWSAVPYEFLATLTAL